jgi:ferredoxin
MLGLGGRGKGEVKELRPRHADAMQGTDEPTVTWPERRVPMYVTGDRQVCVGAGECILAAPQVFGQDEDEGLVVVLQAEPGETEREGVEEAAAHCPSGAVRVD